MARPKSYQPATPALIDETLSKLTNPDDTLRSAEVVGQAMHADLDGDIVPDATGNQRWGLSRFRQWLQDNPSHEADRHFANIGNPERRGRSNTMEQILAGAAPKFEKAPPPTDAEITAGIETWSDEQWVKYDDQHKAVGAAVVDLEKATSKLAIAEQAKRRAVEEAVGTAQKQAERIRGNAAIDEAAKALSQAEVSLKAAQDEYGARFADVIEMARQQELAGKTLVTIDPGNPAMLIQQVIERLAVPSSFERVYSVNGALAYVKPHHAPVRYGREGQGFVGTITTYDANSLSVRIAEQMHFIKEVYTPKDKWMAPSAIDQRIVHEILSRTWLEIPPLRSVGFSPVVTAEGILLDEPRFYPEHGLELRFDPADYADVGDSEAEAQAAYRYLDGILDIFDFAEASDRSAAHLALATLAVIAGFDAIVPFIRIGSVNAMSGKTLLAETLSAVALGMIPRPTPFKSDDVELGKLITSLLYEGASVVLFDNLPRGSIIQSPIIDALITGSGWRDRILGHSKTDVSDAKIPILIFTGTAITFGGDSMTRGLGINLKLPEHGFNCDPRELVLQDRPRVISAVLTIIKAGLRRKQKDLGAEHFRFPQWNRIIRSAYVNGNFSRNINFNGKIVSDGGVPEPFVDPIPIQRAGSSATDAPLELDGLLQALQAVFGKETFHARHVTDKIEDAIPIGGDDNNDPKYEKHRKLKRAIVDLVEAEMRHAKTRTGEVNLNTYLMVRLLKGQVGRTGGNFILRVVNQHATPLMFYVEGGSSAEQAAEDQR